MDSASNNTSTHASARKELTRLQPTNPSAQNEYVLLYVMYNYSYSMTDIKSRARVVCRMTDMYTEREAVSIYLLSCRSVNSGTDAFQQLTHIRWRL